MPNFSFQKITDTLHESPHPKQTIFVLAFFACHNYLLLVGYGFTMVARGKTWK